MPAGGCWGSSLGSTLSLQPGSSSLRGEASSGPALLGPLGGLLRLLMYLGMEQVLPVWGADVEAGGVVETAGVAGESG